MKMQTLKIGFIKTLAELKQAHIDKIRQIAPKAEVSIYTPEDVHANIKDTDILITFPGFPHEIIADANLKWLHSLSAGVNMIVPLLEGKDTLLTNSSGVHPIPIAEHVFGMMLMHARKLDRALLAQKRNEWQPFKFDQVQELNGKTIFILGYGAIGIQIGKLAKAFGMVVIGTKRTKTKEQHADIIITNDELNSYLPKADYIVIALPATPDTFHFIDKDFLAQMKNNAVIVNIGRGDVIDKDALIAFLKERSDVTALLDVFEQEPLPASSPLWSMDNVIITAHYAGATPEYMNRAVAIFCDNLKAYLNGEKMPTLVDKELGY